MCNDISKCVLESANVYSESVSATLHECVKNIYIYVFILASVVRFVNMLRHLRVFSLTVKPQKSFTQSAGNTDVSLVSTQASLLIHF